jgi:hypothetical protein
MKKVFLIVLLPLLGFTQQVRFGDKEYSNISISIDPYASYKESSINAIFEFEYVPNWGYIKPSLQVFPALEGGYVDLAVGFGLNLIQGYEEDWRLYGGIRLGHIFRGNEGYPLFGWELGLDRRISKDFSIGIGSTLDWREDFLFTGGDPAYRLNGKIRFRFNLN